MPALFVTGTDTGVGKTMITGAIAAYCSLTKNIDVGVMKPFEAGLMLRGKDLLPWDAICLKEASGSQDDMALINPYAFEAPLSPLAASEEENVHIDLEMLDRIYQSLLKKHEILFVEGAGGILVPIRKDFFFVDLIKRWNVPVIVVSRLGIGTINHTLLTTRYLKQEGIRVVGVILNDSDSRNDPSKKSNPEILARYLDVPLLGVFPYQEALAKGERPREALAPIVADHIDMGPIIGH
jgi:dethiobiotin synthetase